MASSSWRTTLLALLALLLTLAAKTSAVTVTGTYNGLRLVRTSYDYAPSVIRSGGVDRIWFCAGEYALGTDFNDVIRYSYNWEPSSVVLCPSELGASGVCTTDYPSGPDHGHACDPSVVSANGTYYMYYTAGNRELISGEFWETNYVFLARSANGLNWTKYPSSNQQPIPIITSAHHKRASDPIGPYGTGQQSVVYKDGTFYMYYTDEIWFSESYIQRVESSDGISFANKKTIHNTGPGSPLPLGSRAVDVAYIPGWDLWFMVTNEQAGDNQWGIYWNISRDGVHWLPFSTSRSIPRGIAVAHNPGIIRENSGHVGDTGLGPQTIQVTYGDGNPFDKASDLGQTTITLLPEPLFGFFDGITADKFAVGWAYDRDTGINDAAANGGPSAPLGHSTYVSVWIDGVPQHNWQPAEISRCDVRDAGEAPDCYHGFRIDLKPIVPSGTHRIQIEGGEFPTGSGGRFLTGEHWITMP